MSRFATVYPEQSATKDDESLQNLLYEAARANKEQDDRKRWKQFVRAVDHRKVSKKQIKSLIHNLDERKQWAAIHYAVDSNNIFVFDQLTAGEPRFRCDININGGHGENILHIAAQSDQIWQDEINNEAKNTSAESTSDCIDIAGTSNKKTSIVQCMLDRKADIEDRDDANCTPLHLAVQHNRYDYTRTLLRRGADIMAKTKFHANVLHFTLLCSKTDGDKLYNMVKLLLYHAEKKQVKKKLLGSTTLDNQTPLALAICHSAVTVKLVKKILDDYQFTDKQLLVVFDMVARQSFDTKKSFDYLLPLVESPKFYQNYLSQVLHICCRHDNKSLLEWLQKTPSLKNLISPYLNRTADNTGYTPLFTSISHNSEGCVKFLFESLSIAKHGSYFLQRTKDDENILHICGKHKRKMGKEIFDIIWEKLLNLTNAYNHIGKLLNMKDVEGNLPLEVAVRFNNEYMCAKVFDYMYDKDVGMNDGVRLRLKSVAVFQASEIGNLKMLKLFISSKTNESTDETSSDSDNKLLKARFDNGYTYLHVAAKQNQKKIVDFLIHNIKIDIDALDNRWQTPLHLACEEGHLIIVQTLLQGGASTTSRNFQIYNCLETAIVNQQKQIVQELLEHSTWRDMMRNAQPIENTEGFDTPMRKLIRYMPDMANWLIENRLTRIVGGPGQIVHTTIYDYEFYEDYIEVEKWYKQHLEIESEPSICPNLWHNRGFEVIHTCWCCCLSSTKMKKNGKDWYTNDPYTLVRNHPLFIVSQQSHCPKLLDHSYHIHLRTIKFRSFGLWFFSISFFFYLIYLSLYTATVLMGKHPKYFYDEAQVNMTLDLSTCRYVIDSIMSNPTLAGEILKTSVHRGMKWTLYVILSIHIVKSVILLWSLFPKIFHIGTYFVEISALLLSYVYILDWFPWQSPVHFRCPLQYQLGAMGLLLGYINLLVYLRMTHEIQIGSYIVMLQVISVKFVGFLPVLLVIICGFGFSYWMLLQYQPVYSTPIQALLRTSLMLFELGYEDRLYDEEKGGIAYYKLVYVIFMLTAIACSIFVINLLIGLAVGEIPSLLTQGKLWRAKIFYNLLSDCEILRMRLLIVFDFVTCHQFNSNNSRIPRFRPQPYSTLKIDHNKRNGKTQIFKRAWAYTRKHFIYQQIQDDIIPSTKSTKNNKRR